MPEERGLGEGFTDVGFVMMIVLPVVTASLHTLISVKIPARKGVHPSSVLFKVHGFPLDGGPGLAHTCYVITHGVTRTHLNAPGIEHVWWTEQMDSRRIDRLGQRVQRRH